jgi:hypothetical protein
MARYANNDSRMPFDGKGRHRYLELRPITRWQKGTMPATAAPPKEKKPWPRKVKAWPKKIRYEFTAESF